MRVCHLCYMHRLDKSTFWLVFSGELDVIPQPSHYLIPKIYQVLP